MRTVKVHISTLKIGDTVLHEGALHTVSNSNYRISPGIGHTLYGDSYRLGIIPVIKVLLEKTNESK